MSSSSAGGRGISFSIGAGPRRPEPPPSSDAVLSLLVVADCSGRGARGSIDPLAARRAQKVDIETWQDVVASWQARVETPIVSAAGEPVWLEPRSLDDLHPDRLLEQIPALAEMASALKAAASDPDAATRLAALLGPAAQAPPPLATTAAPANASSSAESSGDTLARLLGGGAGPSTPSTGGGSGVASAGYRPEASGRPAGKVDINQFIRAIIGTPGPSKQEPTPEARALARAAEAELGRRLRLVLAAPALRELEATWRGIDGLCRSCPDEQRVQLFVLDASFDELARDLAGFAACLDRIAPSVLLVDHQFTADAEPLRHLGRLLEVCQARDVELLAAAHPHLAGCAHFAEVTWPEDNDWVFSEEVAAVLAQVFHARERGARFRLALPRFCLRQPYGASGEPIERFRFEEILDASDHEAFPWGNGAYLLARAIELRHDKGSASHPDGSIDVRELPVIYLDGADESRVKPCAESWLSERSLGQLRARGFSVLLGLRDTDRVRVYL